MTPQKLDTKKSIFEVFYLGFKSGQKSKWL